MNISHLGPDARAASSLSTATEPRDVPGSALADELVAALEAVMPRYARVLRHALAADGDERLTLPQLRCLQAMAQCDGPAYASRLARALLVTPPTITRAIDALVMRGLVARQPDPDNRRQIGLLITPAGRALLAHYEAVIAERLHALLTPLDESARKRLLAAIGDLALALDAEERATDGEAS